MTLTKERLAALSDRENVGAICADEIVELARIALASLTAEPVAWVSERNLKNLGKSYSVYVKHEPVMVRPIPLYTAPPTPVSVPISFEEWSRKCDLQIQLCDPQFREKAQYIWNSACAVPPAPVVPDELLSEMEEVLRISDRDHDAWHKAKAGILSCRAAMLQGAEPVSQRDELPFDYLQGQKDGLEWAARLAEANHPQTGDWLYDDPLELAKAIRKGPDMPEAAGNSPAIPDGYALVPVDMAPGMMRAVQINSELGAYAAANLSGAYSLFREFWDAAVAAAPQQEAK